MNVRYGKVALKVYPGRHHRHDLELIVSRRYPEWEAAVRAQFPTAPSVAFDEYDRLSGETRGYFTVPMSRETIQWLLDHNASWEGYCAENALVYLLEQMGTLK